MKKTILLLIITLLGALAVQGKDNISKSVPVAEFDRISITSSITVRYTQSSKHKCTITGTRKDVDNIKVEVKGKQLRLTVKSSERKIAGVTFNSAELIDDVVIDISSPQLHKVELIGSGDFIATTPISTTDLTFSIAGSGDITLGRIATTDFDLNIAGSGDIALQQLKTTNLTAKVAGSGDILIRKIASTCERATLSVAGSGDIDANFDDCRQLKCSIAGTGDITLSGKATNLTTSIVGIGDIDKSRLTVTGRHNRNDVKIATHTSPANYGKIKARP